MCTDSATVKMNPDEQRKEFDMDVLGWVFVALLGLVLAAAVVMGVASLPDAKRYLKLRRM